MTTLTPSVFDFVDEYVDELASRDELPADLDEEEALVLFTREFFTQFFSDVFRYQILAFDAATAADAWVATKERPSAESTTDPIVSAFRAFCQDYATIIGEHYDRGDERTRTRRCRAPARRPHQGGL